MALVSMVANVNAAPPPNDDFANRMVLTGQAVSSTPVDITDATREGLERSETADQTVWYSWTPPQDGIVTITTNTSTFYNRVISVFNGDSLAYLTLAYTTFDYENDDLDDTDLTFPVKAGLTYQISIGNLGGGTETGTAVLNIRNAATTITAPVVICTPADGSDNFANAQSLGSNPVVSGFTYNYDATSEGLESAYDGSHTVWWVWTAPTDGVLSVSTSGTDFYSRLAIYTGSSLGDTQVVSNGNVYGAGPITATFAVTRGTPYHFVIGGVDGGDTGTAVLNLDFKSFFTGETALSNGVLYLSFPNGNYFGYYSYLSNPSYIYHFDLGYEYVFEGANEGVYFYDFKSKDFFYTSPTFAFPYLYDFGLETVLYYYPDPKNAGHYNTGGIRYFYNFATGKIISK